MTEMQGSFSAIPLMAEPMKSVPNNLVKSVPFSSLLILQFQNMRVKASELAGKMPLCYTSGNEKNGGSDKYSLQGTPIGI